MQSEKPAAGLLSGSHFHMTGATWCLDMHAKVEVPCTIKRKKERKKGDFKLKALVRLNKILFHAAKKCVSYQENYAIDLKMCKSQARNNITVM